MNTKIQIVFEFENWQVLNLFSYEKLVVFDGFMVLWGIILYVTFR